MAKKLKIKISLPRNSYDEPLKFVLEDATEFFAKKLMGSRLSNLLKIRVHVRKTVLDIVTKGQVELHANGSKRQRDYLIVLNGKKGLHSTIETLAHEMVHVRQKAKNQLQYKYHQTYGSIMARWKDNPPVPLSDINYLDRPWEIEARKLQRELYKEYIEHVKTKHSNIKKEA
jgi:hypothetical protein